MKPSKMASRRRLIVIVSSIFLIFLMIFLIILPYLPISIDFRTFNKGYKLENAYPNLEFQNLVQLSSDTNNMMYALEQTGILYTFENSPQVESKVKLLDIREQVVCCGEQGLLGLALDPDFATNGYLYVDYTTGNPVKTRISRFQLTQGNIDPNSELVIFEVTQPFSNHNAGTITFGKDNMLYITLGDGGSAGDPNNNGQNRNTYLGSILRIDVSNASINQPYLIPTDNPFVGEENVKEEIWAYGMRNPWRISFDNLTGDLWAGDVGQNSYEEVDLIVKGGNYGWNTMEGFHCYGANECNTTGLTLPIAEYGRNMGKSISGGYVYRGQDLPNLYGKYIYADYISGRFWHLDATHPDNPSPVNFMKYNFAISGFGVDQHQNLYILRYDGIIYKLVSE